VAARAPLIPTWLRQELAPTPHRWRQAILITTSSTVALLVALFLQFAAFPAPLMGFKGLLPNIVHTVPLLALRLAAIAGGAIAGVWIAGIGVQLPWLLLPGFFLTLTVLVYFVPIRQNPIAGYCVALMTVVVTYSGIFEPFQIGGKALTLAIGFATGVTVAAAFSFLRAIPPPRERLAEALAKQLSGLRAALATAGTRFCAADPPGDVPELPPQSALANQLQLLSLVRMQHIDYELERAFVALITVGERTALFVELAFHLSRVPGGRVLRQLCDAELAPLLAALDAGLGRYAAVARTPTAVIEHGLAPAEPWPDFDAMLAALHARETSIHAMPEVVAAIDVEESATFHSFIQALAGIAEVLHTPPEAHEALPPDAGPPVARRLLPPFDKYAAQFAARIGLATTLALMIGVIAHQPALETAVLNPLILAQGSYGATLRQTWLRFAGVLLGGALAILTVVGFMANTDNVGLWAIFYFALVLPCAYVTLGSVRLAYLGQQTAITFMIIMISDRPVTDPTEALWRFFGTVIGAGVLFSIFQVVAPDYAGRQLVSRFADLLRLMLTSHPESDQPLPGAVRARALADQATAALADVLRLAEEARYEGAASGVDPDAALQATGILRRVAHRLSLSRRSRRAGRPPMPEPAATAHAQLGNAIRARLQRLLTMLEARHHRARTDSARHAAAVQAARLAAAASRPDLAAPLAAFVAAADAIRHGDTDWSREDIESLMAEVAHLQRVVQLLPQLEDQLERTIVPDAARLALVAARAPSPHLTTLVHSA
jgi:hypothetical protein